MYIDEKVDLRDKLEAGYPKGNGIIKFRINAVPIPIAGIIIVFLMLLRLKSTTPQMNVISSKIERISK